MTRLYMLIESLLYSRNIRKIIESTSLFYKPCQANKKSEGFFLSFPFFTMILYRMICMILYIKPITSYYDSN